MAKSGRKHAVKIAVGAAAVGVATSVTAVAVTQPASISATLVDLTALIVVGSSTNPTGAGVADFFGGKFNQPMYTGGNAPVYVNFNEGPDGIQAALDAHPNERNAVLASGWGAANASLLFRREDARLGNTVFILDNDVARPDGGFGTRYPLFALIGVNPYPTPSDLPDGVTAVNTGYEYDYNSNAPAYALNPFSAVNALAAYLTTRLNQAEIDLPVDAEGKPVKPNGEPLTCEGANTCALTEAGNVLPCPDARCSSPDDRITAYVTTRNDTTYVTYTTRELPLTTLIRGIFGDYIADVTAPLLKVAVDSGYYGGNPIPSDPSAYRPGRIFPSISDVLTTLVKLPGAILETLAAIVAPFVSRPATTSDTDMMTTQMLSTEDRTDQEKQELTDPLSTGEEIQERTGQKTPEPTNEELTEQELNPEDLQNPGGIANEIAKPLTNVLRNSLQALPGQSFAEANNDTGTTTTDPNSIEPEQNSELDADAGQEAIDNSAAESDPHQGREGDASAEGNADAAA
ncbi:PE-PPE domain-containing protein [Mycobacterium sp. NPDC051804]|uniref:PE-PPE domain-containing protein n=1 Tax=Mycobacterium sp. NPDC051804 TaxID=3364295 RepID=UPI0037ADD59F